MLPDLPCEATAPVDGDSGALLPDDDSFARIAAALSAQGYAVIADGLPASLAVALATQIEADPIGTFSAAGIGRGRDYGIQTRVRRSQILWINGTSEAERDWLHWADRLRIYLNRHIYLGLGGFESQFAHYAPGDYYRRHLDAFRGQANRVLSVIIYLNSDWHADDGGELVIYAPTTGGSDQGATAVLATVRPESGTLVIFLSEEFAHEVLPTRRDRFSIAGWYRRPGDDSLSLCN